MAKLKGMSVIDNTAFCVKHQCIYEKRMKGGCPHCRKAKKLPISHKKKGKGK